MCNSFYSFSICFKIKSVKFLMHEHRFLLLWLYNLDTYSATAQRMLDGNVTFQIMADCFQCAHTYIYLYVFSSVFFKSEFVFKFYVFIKVRKGHKNQMYRYNIRDYGLYHVLHQQFINGAAQIPFFCKS